MGVLPDNNRFEWAIPKLEEAYDIQRKKTPGSDRNLIWAVFSVFRWQLLRNLIWNLCVTAILMSYPIVFYKVTEFIESD